MGLVLVTESYLEDIASAIRTKTGGSASYTPAQMADGVRSIPSGGGGGSDIFFYPGEYIGDTAGATTGSISQTLSGKSGLTAILVVMHRSALTTPSGWTLVDNRQNPSDSSHTTQQQISIFKKVLASNAETVTISQTNSSVRMCACVWYFESDPNLAYHSTQGFDSGATTYHYTVTKKSKPTLVVVSDVFSGSATTTVSPKMAYPNSSVIESGTPIVRLMALTNFAPIDLEIDINLEAEADAIFYNRAFIYTIG